MGNHRLDDRSGIGRRVRHVVDDALRQTGALQRFDHEPLGRRGNARNP